MMDINEIKESYISQYYYEISDEVKTKIQIKLLKMLLFEVERCFDCRKMENKSKLHSQPYLTIMCISLFIIGHYVMES